VNIYREFTAADVSGVYLSGLPVLLYFTTPAPPEPTVPPLPTVSPECSPMPAFIYSDAADFGRQPDSYIAYNISGHEAILVNQYVKLSFCILFTHRTVQFLVTWCNVVTTELIKKL